LLLNRAKDDRLTSSARAELICLVGLVRVPELESEFLELARDSNALVAAEAIRALALLEGFRVPEPQEANSGIPDVERAMEFYRAVREIGDGKAQYLETIHRDLKRRRSQGQGFPPLFRDLISLVQLSDPEALQLVVEALNCRDGMTEFAAIQLLGTIVQFPSQPFPSAEREWYHEPWRAYGSFQARLSQDGLSVRWYPNEGKCIVSDSSK
jgi:hypothetical protein